MRRLNLHHRALSGATAALWLLPWLLSSMLLCAGAAQAQEQEQAQAQAQLLAPGPGAGPGSTVIIGGALKDGNDAVWSRVVQLAGGPGACVAVLATAAGDPDASAAQIIAVLQRHGAVAEHIRVAPRLAASDAAAEAHNPLWAAKVRACRGVFFSGGAQSRLMDTLQPAGLSTPLLQAIRDVWTAGGVVAGTSSGAAVLSHVAFRDAPDVLAVMKGRLRDGQELGQGFGFLPAQVLVDQHFIARGRIGRLLPAMRAKGLALGIGVEEDSAVVVRGNMVEVIGSSGTGGTSSSAGRNAGAGGALIVDLHDADAAPAGGLFRLRNARLHWLGGGDSFVLDTRRVQPSAVKLAGLAIDPAATTFRPYNTGPAAFADILSKDTLLHAMARLVDSDQRQISALSFAVLPTADDPAPGLGFEWRLRVVEGTRGWLLPTSGAATWVDLRLDIVPVRMAQPLYVAEPQ